MDRAFNALLASLNTLRELVDSVYGRPDLRRRDRPRGVFNSPLPGVPEIARLSLVAVFWLQMAHTLRIGSHLRTAMFLDRMSEPARRTVLCSTRCSARCCSPRSPTGPISTRSGVVRPTSSRASTRSASRPGPVVVAGGRRDPDGDPIRHPRLCGRALRLHGPRGPELLRRDEPDQWTPSSSARSPRRRLRHDPARHACRRLARADQCARRLSHLGQAQCRPAHAQSTAYNALNDYIFAVVPLFILMGAFATAVRRDARPVQLDGSAAAARAAAGSASRRFAGNAVFAAITGVRSRAPWCSRKIAIPEMSRLGYDKQVRARHRGVERAARHADPALAPDGRLRRDHRGNHRQAVRRRHRAGDRGRARADRSPSWS